MISDPADEELYQLKVNLISGATEEDTLPRDGKFHLNDQEELEARMDPFERHKLIQQYNSESRGLPKVFK